MTEFWQKSARAAKEAHALLELGFTEGAVSRAYYAMFYAACAALHSFNPDLAEAKTHKTILRRFSQHIVKSRKVKDEAGRSLRLVFDIRLETDYEAPPPKIERARVVVASMDDFIAAVASFIETSTK